jgi:hypothetical protein
MGCANYGVWLRKLTCNVAATCFLSVFAACVASWPVYASPAAPKPVPESRAAPASQTQAVRRMVSWVADSGDNGSLPFVIIDKPEAKAFVFDKNGQLVGSAWVLIGLAPGDDSAPGIGTMPLEAITPEMRTTPAGRFVTTMGHDLGPLDVLWVDYPDAISLHRVINTKPVERRLQRIISPAPADHRISYGCINVPANFFDKVVEPTFKDTKGIVYILPEVKSMRAVFPTYHEVGGNSESQVAASAEPVQATPARYQESTGSVEDHNPPSIVH